MEDGYDFVPEHQHAPLPAPQGPPALLVVPAAEADHEDENQVECVNLPTEEPNEGEPPVEPLMMEPPQQEAAVGGAGSLAAQGGHQQAPAIVNMDNATVHEPADDEALEHLAGDVALVPQGGGDLMALLLQHPGLLQMVNLAAGALAEDPLFVQLLQPAMGAPPPQPLPAGPEDHAVPVVAENQEEEVVAGGVVGSATHTAAVVTVITLGVVVLGALIVTGGGMRFMRRNR